MRCGSICSISVHCTKWIHIFPYTNGSMCAFKKPQADMDCLLLSCRQNTSYKPANQSQPLSHRSGKWEIVTMKERSIKERKWKKNRASNMGTYIIFKDLLIVGIFLRWSDHKSIVKCSTFLCWEITSWLVLSDRGKEWLKVSRWARDCCMWDRAESKLEAELSLLSSLPFFLLFSLMPFRAFCARFVISSLTSTES